MLLAGGLNSKSHEGEYVTRMSAVHGQFGAACLPTSFRWSAAPGLILEEAGRQRGPPVLPCYTHTLTRSLFIFCAGTETQEFAHVRQRLFHRESYIPGSTVSFLSQTLVILSQTM